MTACNPNYDRLALDAARRLAADLSLSKASREGYLRIVRKLEAANG